MPANRLSHYRRGSIPENLFLKTTTQMCFGAAGILGLMQLNVLSGAQSAIAALLPQKVMISTTAASSQQLTDSSFVYFNQSEEVLRKCPWLADKFDSKP